MKITKGREMRGWGRKGDLSATVFSVLRDYDSAIVRKSRQGDGNVRRLLIVINSRARPELFAVNRRQLYGRGATNARY